MAAVTLVDEHVRRGTVRTVPAHHGAVDEVGAGHGEGKATPPAVADEGLIAGQGWHRVGPPVMVKVTPLEVPPPGVGLKTVTDAVPAVAMSAAVMAAVELGRMRRRSWYGSHRSSGPTDPLMKLVPVDGKGEGRATGCGRGGTERTERRYGVGGVDGKGERAGGTAARGRVEHGDRCSACCGDVGGGDGSGQLGCMRRRSWCG